MKNSQQGFTLLEVIIALTIFSFMMISVYELVTSSVDRRDRTLSHDREIVELETALVRLERDLEYLYSPLYFDSPYDEQKINRLLKSSDPNFRYEADIPKFKIPTTESFPRSSSNGILVPAIKNDSKSELLFMTFNHRRAIEDAKESSYAWVSYKVAPAPESKSKNKDEEKPKGDLALYRYSKSTNIYEDTLPDEGIENYYVLIDGIKNFEFQFWNESSQRFVDNLRFLDKKSPPRLLKIILTKLDASGKDVNFEKTYRVLWPNFDTAADDKERFVKPQEINGVTPLQGGASEE